MDNSEQNPILKPKGSPFTTVTYPSKIIALFLFVILPFAGFYLGIRYQKSVTVLPAIVAPLSNKEVAENAQAETKKRLLMTKEVEGGQITAYRLTDGYPDVGDVFAIILEVGQYYPVIFSSSSVGYPEDGLFEIINDELWAVNSQTNKIDVYNFQLEKKTDGVLHLSSLIYKESISLPKYRVGVVFSIKCDKENCTILTAFHLESGCDMVLDLKTKQYSDIKCGGMGGEFIPDKL